MRCPDCERDPAGRCVGHTQRALREEMAEKRAALNSEGCPICKEALPQIKSDVDKAAEEIRTLRACLELEKAMVAVLKSQLACAKGSR